MAGIKAIRGPNAGQTHEIGPDGATLGRNPECDIVLEQVGISRPHARIEILGDEFFIQDLDSLNGTIVNGKRITERCRLRHGDRVKICGLQFEFEDPRPSDSSVVMMVDESDSRSEITSSLDAQADSSRSRISDNSLQKLRAVLGITEDLASAIAMDDVPPRIVAALFRIFHRAQRAFVLLRESPDAPLQTRALARRDGKLESARVSRTIIEKVVSAKAAVLSRGATSNSAPATACRT